MNSKKIKTAPSRETVTLQADKVRKTKHDGRLSVRHQLWQRCHLPPQGGNYLLASSLSLNGSLLVVVKRDNSLKDANSLAVADCNHTSCTGCNGCPQKDDSVNTCVAVTRLQICSWFENCIVLL